MGIVNHFDLAALRAAHGIKHFVETGVGAGEGVAAALAAGFPNIYSIELIEEIHAAARDRFARCPEVLILQADSLAGLQVLLGSGISRDDPVLFWLDAHFPGLGYTTNDAAVEPDDDLRLPLAREIELIRSLRPGVPDIFLIDDARIYVDGPFTYGTLPDWAQTLRAEQRNLDFLYAALGETHEIAIDYAHEGYISALPKGF
jgi:hypothetical protein